MILGLAIAVLVLIVPVEAADIDEYAAASCMSRREARVAYPRGYLYWTYNQKKQRCWSNRRIRHVARQAYASAPEPKPGPQEPIVIAMLKPPPPEQLPYPKHSEPLPSLDRKWGWVDNARAAEHDDNDLPPGTIVFHTFDRPPDVWPALDQKTTVSYVGSLVTFMVTVACAFFAGAWLQRRLRFW